MSKKTFIKKLKKFKKKYKNIYLIFLIVISFTLSNYQKYINMNNIDKDNDKENSISFIVSNDKYDVFTKGYAYVKNDTDLVIQSNVGIISYRTVVEDDMLNFYKWNTPDYSYPIIRLDFKNLIVTDNKIAITKNISYEEFKENIITNTSYKILNNEVEVQEGFITSGMTLKIYYNEEEIDSYNIIDEYLNLDKLNIKNNKYIIKNISTVENLKKDINTTGNIIVLDKDGKKLNDADKITTNSKIKIELPTATYNYTIVVIGDVTGSGDIFIGDISKLYQYYKKIITMEECYIIAGDVTYDNEIEINDIAKLYQYSKGTINSLQ